MHLGNVHAALLSWLSARKQGGRWLLRIEDLDRQRCRPEYAALLVEDLRRLGLDWDGEAVFQSRRDALYEAAFAELSRQGLVYPCFCRRADLCSAFVYPAALAPDEAHDLPFGRDIRRADLDPAVRLLYPHIHSFDALSGQSDLKPVHKNRFSHT